MSERVCGAPATQRVFWPGREPLLMCEAHAERARGVSNAMSFYLAQQPVSDGTCSSITREPAPEGE